MATAVASSSVAPLYERNQEATLYVGNIDIKVTEEILWELFLQCGPVVSVQIPRDKITGDHNGYGFVEFKSEEDADYAIKIMHLVKLYGKPIKVNKASQDKRVQEVGANLFIGNLDPEVDEKSLFETFKAFGLILSTRVARDPESGASKGHGFVSYDSFESSDAAIAAMNGQYFSNRLIKVSYSIKKDSKGDRHGTVAERLLASNRPSLSRPAFFGLQNPSVGNNLVNHMSLLLPQSLVTEYYSRMLSNENPTKTGLPSDRLQPTSTNRVFAGVNSVIPKMDDPLTQAAQQTALAGLGKATGASDSQPATTSHLPHLPPGLPPLPPGITLPPLPPGLPSLPVGLSNLPPLPAGLPPFPSGLPANFSLPPLPPGIQLPPLPSVLPPGSQGALPPLPSLPPGIKLPPLPPGMQLPPLPSLPIPPPNTK